MRDGDRKEESTIRNTLEGYVPGGASYMQSTPERKRRAGVRVLLLLHLEARKKRGGGRGRTRLLLALVTVLFDHSLTTRPFREGAPFLYHGYVPAMVYLFASDTGWYTNSSLVRTVPLRIGTNALRTRMLL